MTYSNKIKRKIFFIVFSEFNRNRLDTTSFERERSGRSRRRRKELTFKDCHTITKEGHTLNLFGNKHVIIIIQHLKRNVHHLLRTR